MDHRPLSALEPHLDHLRSAPRDVGVLALVVRRPGPRKREVVTAGELHPDHGLVGDDWAARGRRRGKMTASYVARSITVMGHRMVSLLADTDEDRAWAGDQLYVDLDLSVTNLPPGSRLAVGESAVVEVTKYPHTGCAKFVERYGEEATRFVNTDEGRALRLRGMNGRVVTPGTVRPGDPVRVLSRGEPPISVSLP
ncbi:MAG TPA: MOSC domain-containing protein [Nocardioides sp.]|uniref:MOSC domain-containing protein n=1 Tax=Nocardioides sp. TaxID=35761 RepID=UPI002D7E5B51|nr:MOSC domain-containing protein [Nocardioides sp.]HET6652070.1 MOSC domain-containing protein [Nocardioides sp.]